MVDQTITAPPHSYAVEVLWNQGGPSERWAPAMEMSDVRQPLSRSGAEGLIEDMRADGHGENAVRLVATAVVAEPGPNSPEHMLLLAYSEWLDGEGLVKPDHEVPSDSGGSYVVDDRPHDQLVAEFLESRAGA